MDAKPIISKIEEIQREMETRFDELDADLGELHAGLSGMGTGTLAEGTAVILAVLTELAEGPVSDETRERLRALTGESGE